MRGNSCEAIEAQETGEEAGKIFGSGKIKGQGAVGGFAPP
jgi:hypothetical protein